MENFDELTKVFRMVFEDDTIELNPEITANDIDGWDSLSHTVLILAIEKHFNIRFNNTELLTFKKVGDLQKSIERLTAENLNK